MIDYDEFMGMAYCTIHDLFFNVLLFDHGSPAPGRFYSASDFVVSLSSALAASIYIHTYHGLRDVFSCQSRLKGSTNAEERGRSRGAGLCYSAFEA